MELTTRRQIERMAAGGRYAAAGDAQQRNASLKAAQAAALRRQVEEEQAAQWLAFDRARRQCEADEIAATRAARTERTAAATLHLSDMQLARDDALQEFTVREATLLTRRPVAHSQAYVETKREERQQAQQGNFGEAGKLQRQAAHIAAKECQAAAVANRKELAGRVAAWERAFECRERNTVRSLHAKDLFDDARTARRVSGTRTRLNRMQANMAAMHEREHRELDTVGHVRSGYGAPYCTATRGTRLERRVITEKQMLPSLCDMYGSLL